MDDTKIIKINQEVYWCGCEITENPPHNWGADSLHSQMILNDQTGFTRRQICDRKEAFRDILYKEIVIK